MLLHIENVNSKQTPWPWCHLREIFAKKAEKIAKNRLIFDFLGQNEGFKILEEDICHHPDCIDVIYLYGYGWPAWRGGPMYWVDKEVGLSTALNKLSDYHSQFPGSDYFEPSKLLVECVERGIGISDYYELKAKGKTSKL